MCDHTNDPGGREAAMTVIERDRNGTATVWCDPCLAPLVTALNAAGLRTIASCCGHGRNDPSVALADGRWITLKTDAPIAYEHRTGAPDESVSCPECGQPRPFGLDFMCLDCNGVRYVSENDWYAHHGCGFEEEWKYQREAREAIEKHLATCEWAEPQGEPSDARVEAAARRLFGATVDSMDRARELARVALTAPPLVACPHWAPGNITFRNGCTACDAVQRDAAGGER